MTRFTSGTSKAVNTRKAVAECLQSAGVDAPAGRILVLVHSSSGHKLDQVLEEIHHLLPEAGVAGCTGSGVSGSAWVSEAMRALAILVIHNNRFAIHSRQGLNGENSARLAHECAAAVKAELPEPQLLFCFGPGLNVNGDALVSGIDEVFDGQVALMGALAGFSGQAPRMPVFHDRSVLDDAVVVVGVADPDLEVVQAAHHGSLPQREQFLVTRSEGQRVIELDGEPAWPRLMQSIGKPADTQPIDVVTLIALGLDLSPADQEAYDNAKLLRAPLMLLDDGSCLFQVDIPEGTRLTSCQRDETYLFEGALRLMERLKARLAGRRPLAVLQADCMARGRMSHNSVEKDGIVRDMQMALSPSRDIPWLGVYGFAEFGMLNGRNRMHNYTTTLSAIVKRE